MTWQIIPDFDNYSVSIEGQIRNNKTGRILALRRNQQGNTFVGLVRDGVQYNRGVTGLVANAFMPDPEPPNFDTIIHLDGDNSNNDVLNFMWRPRWFALKYIRQFRVSDGIADRAIVDVDTGEKFESIWDAIVRYGLLKEHIMFAIYKNERVWPTNQKFAFLEE